MAVGRSSAWRRFLCLSIWDPPRDNDTDEQEPAEETRVTPFERVKSAVMTSPKKANLSPMSDESSPRVAARSEETSRLIDDERLSHPAMGPDGMPEETAYNNTPGYAQLMQKIRSNNYVRGQDSRPGSAASKSRPGSARPGSARPGSARPVSGRPGSSRGGRPVTPASPASLHRTPSTKANTLAPIGSRPSSGRPASSGKARGPRYRRADVGGESMRKQPSMKGSGFSDPMRKSKLGSPSFGKSNGILI